MRDNRTSGAGGEEGEGEGVAAVAGAERSTPKHAVERP